jgi:GNAT superfamily N-acetyltransferase
MNISIHPLEEHDLPAADRIFRLAFGTFLGLPDPMAFMGDADLVKTRWLADPTAAVGAYVDDALVGSNFTSNWGSFGFFGPLTVRPDLWDKGIARKLLEATMGFFEKWGTRQAGLFTFAQSPKHIALYQKYGFWPQHLTAVMSKPIGRTADRGVWSKYSDVPPEQRESCLADCRDLTHAVYPGLDVQLDIRAVAEQQVGDTVLLRDGTAINGLAICHIGAGSEAGSRAAYVKFGAVRPSRDAEKVFGDLLSACEELAAERGVGTLVAGVNTARHGAYLMMIARGFRTFIQGVAMQRPNEPGYNRPDAFVLDDWR